MTTDPLSLDQTKKDETQALTETTESTDLSTKVLTPEESQAMESYNTIDDIANLPNLLSKGKSLLVTDVSQADIITSARETRLTLKRIRAGIENTRKKLKAKIVLDGKAIDGMANIFKAKIVPIEEHLEEQENFVKKIEEKRIADMVNERIVKLMNYVSDLSGYDLGSMSEDGFNHLLSVSKSAFETKKAAEEKAEAERIAKEKADALENERIRLENERLKAEADERAKKDAEREENERIERNEREAKEKAEREASDKAYRAKEIEREKRIEHERKKREAAEAEAQAIKEAQEKREREEKERKEAEEAERLAAEEKAKQAPDKEKLQALASAIVAIEIPEVESEMARDALIEVTGLLMKASTHLKEKY